MQQTQASMICGANWFALTSRFPLSRMTQCHCRLVIAHINVISEIIHTANLSHIRYKRIPSKQATGWSCTILFRMCCYSTHSYQNRRICTEVHPAPFTIVWRLFWEVVLPRQSRNYTQMCSSSLSAGAVCKSPLD